MNLSQLRSLASLFVADPNQTRYSASQYNDALNRAQEQFAMDSRCLWKDAPTYTVVDGTAAYSLPTDFLWEEKVVFKGLQLKAVSRETLEFYKRSDRWDDDSGTPLYYIIDPEEARKQITLFPIPGAADAGANLVLTYYPLPTTMSSDSDNPLNGVSFLTQYHIAIAAYGAWLLALYETMTPEVMAKRTNLNQIYQDKVTEAVDHFKNTASEPMRMRGGRVW